MKGETTVEERTQERIKWLNKVRDFYANRFHVLPMEELSAELIADAAYLAIQYGLDLETLFTDVVKDVRTYYPDIP